MSAADDRKLVAASGSQEAPEPAATRLDELTDGAPDAELVAAAEAWLAANDAAA